MGDYDFLFPQMYDLKKTKETSLKSSATEIASLQICLSAFFCERKLCKEKDTTEIAFLQIHLSVFFLFRKKETKKRFFHAFFRCRKKLADSAMRNCKRKSTKGETPLDSPIIEIQTAKRPLNAPAVINS